MIILRQVSGRKGMKPGSSGIARHFKHSNIDFNNKKGNKPRARTTIAGASHGYLEWESGNMGTRMPAKRKEKNMKNANGSGSVSKCKDRRRKPWKAVITKGFVYDEEECKVRQTRKVIGYYPTRRDAEDALSSYRQNPYDLDARKITLSELYDRWSAVHYEKISPSAARAYKAAYSYLKPLHGESFIKLRPLHIERCISEADTGSPTKANMRKLLNQLYRYAMKSELCSTNYAAMCDSIQGDSPKIIRLPFTEEQESLLWDHAGTPYIDMILINMYSGWRPSELVSLKIADVDIDGGIMYGGMKTSAGKNRAVPIHSKIADFIKKHYDESTASGSEYLFLNPTKMIPISYSDYRLRFSEICKSLGFKHYPHDARHTFVTKAKDAGVNEWILKLIVGHSVQDITEKVYTHRKLNELKSEMKKIP